MIARPPLTLQGLRPEAGDEDLVALGCRRTTFEWVMRKAILASGRVKLVGGAKVLELSSPTQTRVPRVDGVRYRRNGRIRKIAADFVVDASGRDSQAMEWLGNIGARSPEEDLRPSGIVYYTRFYRMKRGAREPRRSKHPAAGDFSWIKFAVFPADDRTFSITLAVPLAAPRLKVVAQTAAFDAMVRSISRSARATSSDPRASCREMHSSHSTGLPLLVVLQSSTVPPATVERSTAPSSISTSRVGDARGPCTDGASKFAVVAAPGLASGAAG